MLSLCCSYYQWSGLEPLTDLPKLLLQTAFSSSPWYLPPTCVFGQTFTLSSLTPTEPGRHLLLKGPPPFFPFKNLLFGFSRRIVFCSVARGNRSDKHHTSIMLSVTELMIHSSENKSPRNFTPGTVIFCKQAGETRGLNNTMCVGVKGQDKRLGFDCQVLKITFLSWRGTPCLVASYAGLKSPELEQSTTAAQFHPLSEKRKEFQMPVLPSALALVTLTNLSLKRWWMMGRTISLKICWEEISRH